MRPAYDDDYVQPVPAPRCPSGVKAAARIWTIMGVLRLLALAALLVLTLGGPASAQKAAPSVPGVAVGVLVALILISAGRQTVKGNAKDTLGYGIASLILGLLGVGAVFLEISMLNRLGSLPEPVVLGMFMDILVAGLGGIALMVAGMLAISGRDAYRAWRQGSVAAG
jgi:hypothetical protein